MTTTWLLNTAAYSVQLAVLVASASAAAMMLRLRAPQPALFFWQCTFVAAIVLPFVHSRAPESADALTASAIVIGRAVSGSAFGLPSLTSLVLAVLACGAVVRVGGLAIGLIRLRAIRRRARPFEPVPELVAMLTRRLDVSADVRISQDVDGPVTIGLRRPTVLLPTRVLTLADSLQRVVLCHELLHVRRRDWAHTIVEEVWCALLWFHPAARLLVSRIALMREAVVDRQTVEVTGDRRAYAQALMTFAEADGRAALPAPSLVRPRHLSERICPARKGGLHVTWSHDRRFRHRLHRALPRHRGCGVTLPHFAHEPRSSSGHSF